MRKNVPMSEAFQARWAIGGPRPTPPIWVGLIVSGIAIRTVVNVLGSHKTKFDNPELPAFQPPDWAQALSRASYIMILLAAVLYAMAPAVVRLGRFYRALLCAWFGFSLLL